MTWTLAEGESPNQETIEYIRQLSEGRTLTVESVMLLAEYLNEHREARHSWPGEGLFGFLSELFSSGGIGDPQIAAVGEAIEAIEREYSLLASAEVNHEPEVKLEAIWVDDLKLPALRGRITVTDSTSRNDYEVDLAAHTCSCAAWYAHRRQFKDRDARLCCVHVAQALKQAIEEQEVKDMPRLFPELLADITARHEGLDYRSHWRLLRIQMRPFIVSHGARVEWCQVYGPNAERQIEKFRLHRTELRWSYGRHPQCAASIAAYIRSLNEA